MRVFKGLLLGAAVLTMGVGQLHADVVVSKATEDGWLFNSTNRGEHLLNNTGANGGRWGAVRFDINILNSATNGGSDFTNSALYTLDSATLTLTEQGARNTTINGIQSGRVGSYFYDTPSTPSWTSSNLATVTWPGNSAGRPGQAGGTGGVGPNNVDPRSNGPGADNLGLNSPANAGDGASWVNHAFVTSNDAETAVVDLTEGGASLVDIQSILSDWVSGNNAGLILAGEFGNQSAWASNDKASGASVGSSIDGDSTFSGTSLEAGNGEAGRAPFLTLSFTQVVPEPSSLALLGLGSVVAGIRRRR